MVAALVFLLIITLVLVNISFSNGSQRFMLKPRVVPSGGAILMFVVLAALASSFGIVQTGETGVVTRLGAIDKTNIKSEGAYFVPPIIEIVHVLNTKQHTIELPPLEANTSNRQQVSTTVSFTIGYNMTEAPEIYRNYRTIEEFDRQVVLPRLEYSVKTVTARFTAVEQIQRRPDVDSQMLAFATGRLKGTGAYITENGLQLRNFKYMDEYQKSIENTQVAQQNLAEAQNTLKVKNLEADQAIATARGQADAQKLLAKTLSKTSLQYEFIKKWDGTLPKVMSSGSNIMDVSSLMEAKNESEKNK